MSAKKNLFQNVATRVDPNIDNNNEEEKARLKAIEEYREFKANMKKFTLAEALAGLGFEHTKTDRGFDALLFGPVVPQPDGEKQPRGLCENAIGGMNAMVDFQKYRSLKWHRHEANYDPSRPADDVVSIYEKNGTWSFWTDKNGVLVPSDLMNIDNMKDSKKKEKLILKRKNMEEKHSAIDQFLMAKLGGSRFLIVLATDLAKQHYQETIHDLLEENYDVVQQKVYERWASAGLKSSVRLGTSEGYKPANKPPEERIATVAKIAESKVTLRVFVETPIASKPVMVLFNPEWENKSEVLNRLLNLGPTEKIISYEAVS